MRKIEKNEHPRLLTPEKGRNSVLPDVGDEIYCNGVFSFNVSEMLRWLADNPQPIVQLPVSIWGPFENKKPCYIDAANLARPIVIAEIAPDYRDFITDIPEYQWITRGYVCIDGQHRIEKATRMGLNTLPGVVLRMEQHIHFLYKGYEKYVEYWNSKLKERTKDSQQWLLQGTSIIKPQ